MCTPSPPRAPGEAGAGLVRAESRASPAWGCSRDLSLSPALPGRASAFLARQPGPDFLSGHEGPPGAQHLSRPEQGSLGTLLLCLAVFLRRDEEWPRLHPHCPVKGAQRAEEATTGPPRAPAESPPPSS